MERAVWLAALAVAGTMVGVGIAVHPSLIVGGGLIAAIALVKSLQLAWEAR